MKTLWIALVLIVIAAFVVLLWAGQQQPSVTNASTSNSASVAEHPSYPSLAQAQQREYAVTDRVPSYYQTPPDVKTLALTLSPELFTGNKRLAYQAAKEIPQTLAQLPCYCHCDRGHNHKSLHSCFESEHGENCGICIGEALMAHNLQKQGVTVSEIRKQIIAAYGQN
ncbi:MAG TPA: CYCXC family (seleno)protein [Pyrinomonadaceae bacterium]|nr:CYCXC family (seleno)protein [Pyrinomonadaceae bacterium]